MRNFKFQLIIVVDVNNNTYDNLVGVGFKNKHYSEIIDTKPAIGWLEAHAENYFYKNTRSYRNW